MLAQAPVRVVTDSDPTLERAAWVLAAAVLGLIVRELWQTWRGRQDRRVHDRVILSALLREVSAIRGLANSIVHDVDRERQLLATARWRLKPLVVLPTDTYDLVKDRPPHSLLEQHRAVGHLMRLQTQCAYTNALAAEQQRWKSPTARGQADQIEVIASFHDSILESVAVVIERCELLRQMLQAAGDKVGGLNLFGPPGKKPVGAGFEQSS